MPTTEPVKPVRSRLGRPTIALPPAPPSPLNNPPEAAVPARLELCEQLPGFARRPRHRPPWPFAPTLPPGSAAGNLRYRQCGCPGSRRLAPLRIDASRPADCGRRSGCPEPTSPRTRIAASDPLLAASWKYGQLNPASLDCCRFRSFAWDAMWSGRTRPPPNALYAIAVNPPCPRLHPSSGAQ